MFFSENFHWFVLLKTCLVKSFLKRLICLYPQMSSYFKTWTIVTKLTFVYSTQNIFGQDHFNSNPEIIYFFNFWSYNWIQYNFKVWNIHIVLMFAQFQAFAAMMFLCPRNPCSPVNLDILQYIRRQTFDSYFPVSPPWHPPPKWI